MEIALIWAMAKNRVIGVNNGLPWRLPDDMRHFMRTTRGHPVIMGRRTFESMPKPLPGRTNIVLSGRADYSPAGALVAPDFETGLAIARANCEREGKQPSGKQRAFVIGGAPVYAAALALADRLYVTWVDAEVGGDTIFPEVDWRQWRELCSHDHAADATHAHAFRIATYARKDWQARLA